MRTSSSHPLEIASVQVGNGLGRIGLSFCPGKQQPDSATGGWARDLAIDLDVVMQWGAVAVVTLVEPHELASLRVEWLGQAVADRHMIWHHLPIRDVDVPDAAFEDAWALVGTQLRAILLHGFDILVHCKGGLGRAGLVSARLLVELGWDAAEAISAIRRVRPGAIETERQVAHVHARPAVRPILPNPSHDGITDRAKGALLGLAVGDALGTTLEFSPRDSQTRLTDMVGGGPFRLKPGEWTDDTAMALALAESVIERDRLDPMDLASRWLNWWRQGDYSCTGHCFDIGITTRDALARFERDADPFAGSTDPMTAGNGALMRLAPVAIRWWPEPDALAAAAILQARVTHGAEEAIDASALFAHILAEAIAGQPRDHILRTRHVTGSQRLTAIAAGSWRGRPRAEIRSSGYVLDSLEAALWCVARTGTFADAVLLAANLGDDADTTAAITGQLAGALYGASAIPQNWLDRLAWREKIDALAFQLATPTLAPVRSARLKLEPGRWYGWTMWPGYIRNPYHSPILLIESQVEADSATLTVGKLDYPSGTGSHEHALRILVHREHYLLAEITDSDRSVAIVPITEEWIERHHPAIAKLMARQAAADPDASLEERLNRIAKQT